MRNGGGEGSVRSLELGRDLSIMVSVQSRGAAAAAAAVGCCQFKVTGSLGVPGVVTLASSSTCNCNLRIVVTDSALSTSKKRLDKPSTKMDLGL